MAHLGATLVTPPAPFPSWRAAVGVMAMPEGGLKVDREQKETPQQSRPQPRRQAQPIQVPANIPLNQPQLADIHNPVREAVGVRLEALEAAAGYPVVAYFLDEGAALADEQMYHLFEHLRRLDQIGRASC